MTRSAAWSGGVTSARFMRTAAGLLFAPRGGKGECRHRFAHMTVLALLSWTFSVTFQTNSSDTMYVCIAKPSRVVWEVW